MAETAKTDEQHQPPSLLFMVVEEKEKQQAAAVPLVSQWTLFNAVAAAVAFAVAYTLSVVYTTTTGDGHACCCCSRDATHAFVFVQQMRKVGDVLVVWYAGCSVLQAAAAALALKVAASQRRRALAYVALALAVASHCVFAGAFVAAFFFADNGVPGQLSLKVGSIMAVITLPLGDALCLQALRPDLLL